MVSKKKKTETSMEAEQSQLSNTKNPPQKRGQAFVFISHDNRDAALAEAFANLLSDVSGGTLKSFRSSDKKGVSGIEFGTEWYSAIMAQIGDATDVVALLTHHSTDRPWILYEAGVAKGKLDSNVLGIALGVPLDKVSTGPFGQFQNCSDDEDSLTKLVIQLIKRNPDASPREEAVRKQVTQFLIDIKTLVTNKGKSTPSTSDESNVAKLFEEVKIMVRDLPERVNDHINSGKKGGMKRMRKFYPMFIEELLFHPAIRKNSNGNAVAWLLFISFFRNDIPWLYEVGLDLYRALSSGNRSAIATAKKELISILDVTTGGGFLRELSYADGEDIYYLLRQLPEIVDRFFASFVDFETPLRRRILQESSENSTDTKKT